MKTVTKQLTVAKCTEQELDDVREYLQSLKEVVEEVGTEDGKAIADIARKYPPRAFIVPLNLGIMLDNYQDAEPKILTHPKWIKDIYSLLEDMNAYLEKHPANCIISTSGFGARIKELLKDGE
jgi:hypothetical protein